MIASNYADQSHGDESADGDGFGSTSRKAIESFCAKNFPQQRFGESFLTTESFSTEVPRFASMRADCMSDKSMDTAAVSVVKGHSPVPPEVSNLVERLVNRTHPEMKPPAFVKGLKIDTSNESAGRIVSLASLPFFSGQLTTATTVTGMFGTQQASQQKKGFLNLDLLSSKTNTQKPAFKPSWGSFMWWVVCGGDGPSTVVPMS
jgi:hypothetical protein